MCSDWIAVLIWLYWEGNWQWPPTQSLPLSSGSGFVIKLLSYEGFWKIMLWLRSCWGDSDERFSTVLTGGDENFHKSLLAELLLENWSSIPTAQAHANTGCHSSEILTLTSALHLLHQVFDNLAPDIWT